MLNRYVKARILSLLLLAVYAAFAVCAGSGGTAHAYRSAPLSCLIVGGGPDRQNNPVALENNISYVRRLLPSDTSARVLYANAHLSEPIVRVWDSRIKGSNAYSYRTSALGHVDGPATAPAFQSALGQLANSQSGPILLYFTGHGSEDPDGSYNDNAFDLWGGDKLTVSGLTQSLGELGRARPVTLIMVQCFSGAFAQAFFAGSSGADPVVRPDSCGFFASVAQREAAGCTPDINQADYHDFTTYFFGALTGRDRMGRRVASADYDHNGIVGMDEAYAYTLIHDDSIDTPVATSDAYARRFTQIPDDQVFRTSYALDYSWASPAQRAALAALSNQLHLSGDDRLLKAYAMFLRRTSPSAPNNWSDEEVTARWIRFVRLAKTVALEHEILISGPPPVQAGLRELLSAEHADPFAQSAP